MKKLFLTVVFVFAMGIYMPSSASNILINNNQLRVDCGAFAHAVASDYATYGGNYYEIYFSAMSTCIDIYF